MPGVTGVEAAVLFCDDLEAVVDFYRALGWPLEPSRFDGEEPFYLGELGGFTLVLDPARAPSSSTGVRDWQAGEARLSFATEGLEQLVASLRKSYQVVTEPGPTPFGLRAVVLDPEGRPVELVESRSVD